MHKWFTVDVTIVEHFILQFNYMNTEEYFDIVTVYDGHQEQTSSMLGQFSGTFGPAEIEMVSSSHMMLVTFTSDHSGMTTGFNATWTTSKIDYLTFFRIVFLYIV